MKAVFFEEHGGIEVLQYGDFAEPQPGPGEVLVRLEAAALNHVDLFVREGLPGLEPELPHILGSDGAGEVAALGEQFYAAVCEKPGETMMVLAHEVGMTPGELKVPVARLRRSGRLRCVGRKSHMRYFPMVGEAKADKEVAA